MSAKYFAILTNQGAARLANAAALGTQLNLTQMAVGDANGVLPTPDPTQTALVNQRRIAPINLIDVDPKNPAQIIVEQVIPENEGGFWIREIGLYDNEGLLVAVANCPETYKPLLQEGSGRTQTIRMVLIVSSTAAVTLRIDPAVVLATRKYADDKAIEVRTYVDNQMRAHEKSLNHPDGTTTSRGFVQLSSATNSDSEGLAATPRAVKAAMENANGRLETRQNGADIPNKKLFARNIGAVTSTSFSFNPVAGWHKIAHVVMPQATSTAAINFIGGSGYNAHSPAQAAISEIVLRAGNGEPVGLSATLYRRTPAGVLDVAWVNTGGDKYDIYVLISQYAIGLIAQCDYTSNADVTFVEHTTVTEIQPPNTTKGYVVTQYSNLMKPTPEDVGAVSASGGYYNSAYRFASVGTIPTESNAVSLYSQTGAVDIIASGAAFHWYEHQFDIGTVRDSGTGVTGFGVKYNGRYAALIKPEGDIFAERGVFESGGAVRVYSANNPPPNMVTGLRMVRQPAMQFDKYGGVVSPGGFLIGGDYNDNNSSMEWAYLQEYINGAWVTILW